MGETIHLFENKYDPIELNDFENLERNWIISIYSDLMIDFTNSISKTFFQNLSEKYNKKVHKIIEKFPTKLGNYGDFKCYWNYHVSSLGKYILKFMK